MQRWLATNSPERNVILLLSRQAAKKTTQFSTNRICKYFNFDQKHISTSNYLGLVQAAPLPTLVGRVACCQLDLHAGCGTPQGLSQGPAAPLAGLLRALLLLTITSGP